jgi:hypothetical protein
MADAAVTLDAAAFQTSDDVTALLQCVPTPEEAKMLASYVASLQPGPDRQIDGLTPAERFCLDLTKVRCGGVSHLSACLCLSVCLSVWLAPSGLCHSTVGASVCLTCRWSGWACDWKRSARRALRAWRSCTRLPPSWRCTCKRMRRSVRLSVL